MQINLTGHQVEISSSLRNYAMEKLKRLEHYSDKITSIHLIFNAEKSEKTAEATIWLKKKEIHASSTEEDLYSATDALVDKLVRQISKYKEKITEHRE